MNTFNMGFNCGVFTTLIFIVGYIVVMEIRDR